MIYYFFQQTPYWFLFSGRRSVGSGVEVLNHLFGSIGFVYKSSEETECLCRYHLATVIFSVPSISESDSELLLSLLSEGELYCAPVSFTCSVSVNSV